MKKRPNKTDNNNNNNNIIDYSDANHPSHEKASK